MILCVAANPSIDRLFAVERLVPGTIHRPADFAQVAGGKGLNVARAAAALGGRVQAAALLGGHAGRWVAEQLEASAVELHAAWAEAETRSSLSVEGALEGLTEFYEHGSPVSAAEWDGFAALVARVAPARGLDDAVGLAACGSAGRRLPAADGAGPHRAGYARGRHRGAAAGGEAERGRGCDADRPRAPEPPPKPRSRPAGCTRPPAAPPSSRSAATGR